MMGINFRQIFPQLGASTLIFINAKMVVSLGIIVIISGNYVCKLSFGLLVWLWMIIFVLGGSLCLMYAELRTKMFYTKRK